jgi:5,10-methylenetetrahydromethanopterin reductase
MMKREISIAFQTDKSAAQYIALAKLVNEYDFDAVSVYCDAPYHPPFAPLMLMAPHIERARVGVAAASPSRIHPIDMAAQTALLADLARGGVYVGLARGAWLNAHAIQEHQPALRAIREAVGVIRYLLSGQTGGYQGEVYRLAAHVRAPYPLPDYPVPILIGTWGPRLCALAGEIADEVKIGGSANPDIVPVIRRYVATGEAQAGRATGSVGIVVGAVTVVDQDRQLARHAARRAVALYLPVVAGLDSTLTLEPQFIEGMRTLANRGDWDSAGGMVSDELLDRFAFSGNASDIVDQANRVFAAGASRIEFGTPHGLTSEGGILILGQQVLPALRGVWPA